MRVVILTAFLMTIPIRLRLAATATLGFALLFAAGALAIYVGLARSLDAGASTRLGELSDALRAHIRLSGGTASLDYDPNNLELAALVQEASEFYQLFDAETGLMLMQSERLATLGLGLTSAEVRAFRANQARIDIQTDAAHLRIATSLITGAKNRVYLLQVGVSLLPIEATRRRIRGVLARIVPAASVLAGVPAWWLSGFALAPLSCLAAAARTLNAARPDRRLPVRGVRDDVDAIAHAVNARLSLSSPTENAGPAAVAPQHQNET